MTYRFVYVWDTVTKKILYKLPGHNGSVNDVDFHPSEPICKHFYNFFFFSSDVFLFVFFFLKKAC